MENNGYGCFADFYDSLMGDFDYNALAEYCDALIRENGVDRGILLDLACGTGTLSYLLAERGWDVIGVDVSAEMLARAKPHKNISYIRQDMNELDLFGTIDSAVCTLDGLNHLENRSELLAVLKRVSLFMNRGGVFVFDLNTIHKHKTILGNNIFIKEEEDVYCVWKNFYLGSGVLEINLDIFIEREDGAYDRFSEEIRETAYDLDLIRELCGLAGFEITGCYDFMTRDLPLQFSEKVVFICKKVQ